MKKQDEKFGYINANTPILMTGLLWFAEEYDDGSNSPMSLKEFKDSIWRDEPSAKLSGGRTIPKDEKGNQQLIFDCVRIEDDETSSFTLLLREDGTVSGKIEFPLYDGEPVEYFKGDYLISNSKITIWGVWDMDFELEDLHSIFIELKKIKRPEELIYDIDEAIEFIRDYISYELNDKLGDQDIVKLVDLGEEYIEMEYQINKKKKPFIAFDLKTINEENLNDYVLKNAVKHSIILNIDEIEDITSAELAYMIDAGLATEYEIYDN